MTASLLFLLLSSAAIVNPTIGWVSRGHVSNRQTSHESHSTLTMEMAPFKKPRRQNVPGNLYIDDSCIDCDVCRWMCPSVYARKGIKSAVFKQPIDEDEKLQAYAAMIACPVGSIRTTVSDPLVKQALDIFPSEIDPENIPGIMHLGYHSVASYGATPYLVVRANKDGNLMIDTPRFNARLADVIAREGELKYIILTHKDDVADHEKWHNRFPNAQRIIHRTDAVGNSSKCEILLEGGGFWTPEEDFEIIHTPGHTAGSLSILVRTGKENVLFTGDHLAYSESRKGLEGFKRYNHGNIKVQGDSMRMLASNEYNFTWILPGHGRMVRFESLSRKQSAILKAADGFDKEDQSDGMFSVGYY